MQWMNKVKLPGTVITSTQAFVCMVVAFLVSDPQQKMKKMKKKKTRTHTECGRGSKNATMTGRYITWPYNFIIATATNKLEQKWNWVENDSGRIQARIEYKKGKNKTKTKSTQQKCATSMRNDSF